MLQSNCLEKHNEASLKPFLTTIKVQTMLCGGTRRDTDSMSGGEVKFTWKSYEGKEKTGE